MLWEILTGREKKQKSSRQGRQAVKVEGFRAKLRAQAKWLTWAKGQPGLERVPVHPSLFM